MRFERRYIEGQYKSRLIKVFFLNSQYFLYSNKDLVQLPNEKVKKILASFQYFFVFGFVNIDDQSCSPIFTISDENYFINDLVGSKKMYILLYLHFEFLEDLSQIKGNYYEKNQGFFWKQTSINMWLKKPCD